MRIRSASLVLAACAAAAGWRLDAGLWRGRRFPGAGSGPAFASVHVGVDGATAAGEFSVDAFTARLRPDGRGTRLAHAPGGHTHAAPACDEALREVVCFSGDSRVSGWSVRWDRSPWPVTLSAGWMSRREDGSLESRNGIGDYAGRTRGAWFDGVWRFTPRGDLGLRREALRARHALTGPGASLVAAEAGFDRYAPLRRDTATLGFQAGPWADVRVAAGRERSDARATRFASLRLLLHWHRAP